VAEPIITSIALGVAGNLATSMLQFQATRFRQSKLGDALAHVGLLRPDFDKRTHDALERTINNFFALYPMYRIPEIISFFENGGLSQSFFGKLLDREKVDLNIIVTQLSDHIGIPEERAPRDWPNGIIPDLLVRRFIDEFFRALGDDADDGMIWLSQQIAELVPSIDKIDTSLRALRDDLPILVNKAEREFIADQRSDFEKRYLEHLKSRYGRLTTPGARELHGLSQSLSIAYISLNVQSSIRAEPIRAEQFLLERPLITVRGPAGSGKTTLLNWLIMRCAEGPQETDNPWNGIVPFFVPLRRIVGDALGPLVSKFVDYSVDEQTWIGAPIPAEWLQRVLKDQARGVVLLDGVDELPGARRSEFWAWVENFVREYPGNRVIVTSRTLPNTGGAAGTGRTDQWNPPQQFADAHLLDMSDSDVTHFVHHWHDAVEQTKLDQNELTALKNAKETLPKKLEDPANRRIRDLCSTPLLCAMVCVLHWREEGYLPRQRVDLYDKCCDMLIEARDLKRGVRPSTGSIAALTKNDKEMVLQRLAIEMMQNKPDWDESAKGAYRIEITRSKALDWIKPKIASFQSSEARNASPEDVLDFLIERTGLLREPAKGLIDFPHRTFQEYLAACAAGAASQEDFLAKESDDDQWHETIMLAAGTATGGVSFGRRLIDALIRRGQRHKSSRSRSQRIRKTCFALALGCLENLRQHDPELRDRVLSNLSELVPPRNETDARILSVAGDAAVQHLQYPAWKSETVATVAACAAALRLIATIEGLKSLRLGYISDAREAVIAEMCKTGAFQYADIPLVRDWVLQNGEIPRFAAVQNLKLLLGMKNIRTLELVGPEIRFIEDVSLLEELKLIRLVGFGNEVLRDIEWPRVIEQVYLINCKTQDLNWLYRLGSLRELIVAGNPALEELPALTSVEELSLFDVPRFDGRSLGKLLSLRSLTIESCRGITSIAPLKELPSLDTLTIDDCPSISNLSSLEDMLNLEALSIVGGDRRVELLPKFSQRSKIKSLTISMLQNISDLMFAERLQQLEKLSAI